MEEMSLQSDLMKKQESKNIIGIITNTQNTLFSLPSIDISALENVKNKLELLGYYSNDISEGFGFDIQKEELLGWFTYQPIECFRMKILILIYASGMADISLINTPDILDNKHYDLTREGIKCNKEVPINIILDWAEKAKKSPQWNDEDNMRRYLINLDRPGSDVYINNV